MYLVHLLGASDKNNGYHTPSAVPVTVGLTASMRKQFISDHSNIPLSFSCNV